MLTRTWPRGENAAMESKARNAFDLTLRPDDDRHARPLQAAVMVDESRGTQDRIDRNASVDEPVDEETTFGNEDPFCFEITVGERGESVDTVVTDMHVARMVACGMESLVAEVKRLLDESNYVAVGMLIRNSTADEAERYEAVGLAVAAVMAELSVERNRERIIFLRTMLSWFFREAPGLSSLYREQLRMIHGRPSPWQDISNIARFLGDLGAGAAGGGGSAGGAAPDAEETAERVRDFSERLRERGEDFQEQVKDFFSQSGIDLDEGMKRANEFFDSISGRRPPPDDDSHDSETR